MIDSVNVPTVSSDIITKMDDLDVGNLKTVPIDLKKLFDVVSKEVTQKTVHDKINTKVNNLEKKFLILLL